MASLSAIEESLYHGGERCGGTFDISILDIMFSMPPHRPKPLVTGIENLACSCFCKIAAFFAKLEHFTRLLRSVGAVGDPKLLLQRICRFQTSYRLRRMVS
jgi:hypothetical protein